MPNDNEEGGTPNEPQYVTPDQLGQAINSAITSHLKRLNIAGQIADALKPVTEQLAAAKQAPPPAEDEGTSKSKKSNPELEAMRQQLAAMNETLAAERKQRAEVEQKARDTKAFSEVRSALEGKIRPEFADIVAKNLFHLEQRVQFDEQGNATFKSTRVPYVGAEAEEIFLPIADGVADYLKSPAAKPFLPAPSDGAGATPLPKKSSGTPVPTNRPPQNDSERVARAKANEARIQQRMAAGEQ